MAFESDKGKHMNVTGKPRFFLGRTLATPGAMEALEKAGQDPVDLFKRHCCGDWGEIPPEDAQANEDALKTGLRLMSVYTLSTGVTIWAITEADRRSSTLLLPGEY